MELSKMAKNNINLSLKNIQFFFVFIANLAISGFCLSMENPPFTLNYQADLAEGSIITITAKENYSFGDHGPQLLFYNDLSQSSVDKELNISSSLGRGKASKRGREAQFVRAFPELPYGKGLEIGTYSATQPRYKILDVIDTKSENEIYEFMYIYWPLVNQLNAINLLDEKSLWNFKMMWHFQESDGYSNKTAIDLVFGLMLWNKRYWVQTNPISSNKRPSSTSIKGKNGYNFANSPHIRSSPLNRQIWAKFGAIPGSAKESDGFYQLTDIETGISSYLDFKDNGVWSGYENTQPLGVDRITIPGFVRGFPIDQGAAFYYSQIYQTRGLGAPARVEVTDNIDYKQSKRRTIFIVSEWSSQKIIATIKKGIFYQESLINKYLHIFDADNIYIGVRKVI
jgi:hypothetical protein